VKNVITRTYSATDYITVAELKTHLRITSSDDDTYLANLLNAVFDYASNLCGYELRKSVVDYFFNDPDKYSKFHIPARILSLTTVKNRDSNGDLQTIAAADYDEVLTISANYGYDITLINTPSSIYDYGWRYKISVVEGWYKASDTSQDVSKIFPDGLRAAIYMFAEHLYTNRGSQVIGASTDILTWNHEHLFSPYSIKEFV
jgi:uncharacterized phiE125 gp8 family phage protein